MADPLLKIQKKPYLIHLQHSKHNSLMKKVVLTSNPLFSWVNQAKQYPEHGNGIVYFKGFIEASIWVDCLLYYGEITFYKES